MREKTGCKGQMNNDGILAGYTDKELLQIIGSDVEAELRKRGYRYGWYKQEEVAGCIYILYNDLNSFIFKCIQSILIRSS